jgi:hypothetical protein
MVRSFNDHMTLQTVTQVDKNVILVWSGVLMITGHYVMSCDHENSRPYQNHIFIHLSYCL